MFSGVLPQKIIIFFPKYPVECTSFKIKHKDIFTSFYFTSAEEKLYIEETLNEVKTYELHYIMKK